MEDSHFADTVYRAGTFKRPLFATDGLTCVGVETTDGTQYFADKIVLAAGAWSPTLIDLEGQCVSKVILSIDGSYLCEASCTSLLTLIFTKFCAQAWVFAHIQLTPQEAAEYKNAPVVYDGEYGFFFEPNESVTTHDYLQIERPLLTFVLPGTE